MCRKVDELCRALTADDLSALEVLSGANGQATSNRSMPFPLTQRLMSLGLVELSCGGLDLTVAGRMALASMQAHQSRFEPAGVA